ncbi:MAG: methyltransferase domain-containing protein [Chthoniobacterales bacterium]
MNSNITADDLVRLFRSEALKRTERPAAPAEATPRLSLPRLHDLPEIRDLGSDAAASNGQTVVRLSQSIEQVHSDLAALRSALRPLIEDFQLRANDLTEQLYRSRNEATEQWEAVREARWDLMNLAEDLTTTTAGADKLRGEVARAVMDVTANTAGVQALHNDIAPLVDGYPQLRGEVAQSASDVSSNATAVQALRGEIARLADESAQMQEATSRLEARTTTVDRGVAAANETATELALQMTRSSQVNAGAVSRLEERVENDAVYLKAQLSRLTALLDNVKRPAAKRSPRGAKAQLQSAEVDADFDAFYLAFENEFRGRRSEIKSRLAVYLPFLNAAAVPKKEGSILDLGCGRGEWLELLKENKFRGGSGVDLNGAMVEQCAARGLAVIHADAIEHLRSQKNDSLAAVTSFHLIEHLAFRELMELLREIHRVLQPGGLAILETPNPRNILVGASDFFRDLTHNHPVHPDTIRFTLQTIGFAEVRCYFLGDDANGRSAIPDKDFVFRDLQSYVEVPRDFAAIAHKA